MNEEIHCITNKGKVAQNERENGDILRALCSVYKKSRQFFRTYLLINLFKQGYLSSVKSYKHLNKFVS